MPTLDSAHSRFILFEDREETKITVTYKRDTYT